MRPRLPIPAAATRLLNRPTGIAGRHRPFYVLNVVDWFRGSRSVEGAVGGQVVLVTGASSGIGEAAALRLGEAGATVLLVARTREKLEDLGERIEAVGGSAHVHPCDLSEPDDVARMASEALERHGRVDVLVNNAGKSIRRSIELSYDRFHDFERTMQLNYFAPVRLILALLPSMRERGSGQIVNVSSAGVPVRVPRFSAYIASKAALDAFSDCVAPEVAADGVSITSIHMPLVRTPMIEPTTIYRSFPAITPEEAADRIVQGIVYRPRQIGTPLGNLAAFSSAVSPTALDAIRSAGYQLFPDSGAAKGDSGEDSDSDGISRAGEIFANVLRGVHW